MEQKVLILDTMLEQARETPDIFQRVSHGLDKLIRFADEGHTVASYLKKHNGKKMRNA